MSVNPLYISWIIKISDDRLDVVANRRLSLVNGTDSLPLLLEVVLFGEVSPTGVWPKFYIIFS